MAVLTVQDVPAQGVDNITLVPATSGGDSVNVSGGNLALVVKNADAATKTVTIVTPGKVDGLDITDIVRIVPATTGLAVVPLLGRLVGSVASITYSAVTSVSVGVIRLAK